MLCLWAAIARSGSLRVEVPGAAFAAGCSPGRGPPDEACVVLSVCWSAARNLLVRLNERMCHCRSLVPKRFGW
jgi:hypothetical protein